MNTPAIIRKGFFIIKNLKEERTTLPIASMTAIELLNLGFVASPNDLTFLSVDELKELVQQAARLIGRIEPGSHFTQAFLKKFLRQRKGNYTSTQYSTTLAKVNGGQNITVPCYENH